MRYLACLILLAGCAENAPQMPPLSDDCGASRYEALRGQPVPAIREMKFNGPHRIIPFASAISADYRPERLNFEVGPDGTITNIACY